MMDRKMVGGRFWLLLLAVLVLVGVLLPGSLAVTKPVTGVVVSQGDGDPLLVELYVQVDSLGGQLCRVVPAPLVGSGGVFSTNLGNLRLVGHPSVDCSGLWGHGDVMWYEVEYSGGSWSLPVERVSAGTGLQRLAPLVVGASAASVLLPSAGGGAAAGPDLGGARPIIGLSLSARQFADRVVASVAVTNRGSSRSGILRWVITSYPGGVVVDTREERVSLADLEIYEETFLFKGLEPGNYRVQVWAVEDDRLLAASVLQRFTVPVPGAEQELALPPLPQRPGVFDWLSSAGSGVNLEEVLLGITLLLFSLTLVFGVALLLLLPKRPASP